MNVLWYVVGAILLSMGYLAQSARWLRVLQREHYDPSAPPRFARRWMSLRAWGSSSSSRGDRLSALGPVLLVVVVVGLLARWTVLVVLASSWYALSCPLGLSIRGRTGRLEWTRRLRTVAGLTTVLALVVALLGVVSGDPFVGGVVVVLVVPGMIELSTRLLRPFEERRARAYVAQAHRRLQRVSPTVVAITGSYGKTSTKNHLATLLRDHAAVVASPRSYNNRAGLSRTINENVAEGTSVFIAEMGTYGPGEIRDLTSWCTPEVAVVTAIGPVHLERMKTLDVIESAKYEITELARTVVVNIDDRRLAGWPGALREAGKRVITASSTNEDADVRVSREARRWTLFVEGVNLGSFDEVLGVQPSNLACALGAAIALGVDRVGLVERARRVESVASRLHVTTASSGVVVVDDTFNANPASAEAALAVLSSLELSRRRVVVTPGLVELGDQQVQENVRLAQRVSALPGELVIVARTNAAALQDGYAHSARRFRTRDEAVSWVRASLGPGDGVLYLNDLPDHYP